MDRADSHTKNKQKRMEHSRLLSNHFNVFTWSHSLGIVLIRMASAIVMMYLLSRLQRAVLNLALPHTHYTTSLHCLCLRRNPGPEEATVSCRSKFSRRVNFWMEPGPREPSTYLSKFARGGRDDAHPEANVDAHRGLVQNERELGRKYKCKI